MTNESNFIPAGNVPYNEVTGNDYSLANALDLYTAQLANDFSTGQWAGYQQWRQIGRSVMRGQKATRVMLLIEKIVKGKKTKKLITLCVFNVDQTEAMVKS